jgi:hypothetical protein
VPARQNEPARLVFGQLGIFLKLQGVFVAVNCFFEPFRPKCPPFEPQVRVPARQNGSGTGAFEPWCRGWPGFFMASGWVEYATGFAQVKGLALRMQTTLPDSLRCGLLTLERCTSDLHVGWHDVCKVLYQCDDRPLIMTCAQACHPWSVGHTAPQFRLHLFCPQTNGVLVTVTANRQSTCTGLQLHVIL